ncbi:ankyrin repeat domain-containing protein [Brachyspira aalborgi]|uniref:Ankyrin repeat domain-containing protein n=2 Tax=Brachyspira aalborgi TaxID=29522 RepID=A0A5C8D3F6_9SPIR|nr:ankyrin repeat domain-containing protein [Brachyspira aalborgi]
MDAIANNDIEELNSILIQSNTDINEKFKVTINDDEYEITPLSFALYNENYDSTKLLIENGADIDIIANEYKDNALTYSTIESNFDIVELLVENGANINAKDSLKL